MTDTAKPQPLSQQDLDVVRAVFKEAKVGDYRGLDDFGDSKTPFHEGWNECLDHCFEKLAPTIHADRAEPRRLHAVLADVCEPSDLMLRALQAARKENPHTPGTYKFLAYDAGCQNTFDAIRDAIRTAVAQAKKAAG